MSIRSVRIILYEFFINNSFIFRIIVKTHVTTRILFINVTHMNIHDQLFYGTTSLTTFCIKEDIDTGVRRGVVVLSYFVFTLYSLHQS